MSVSTLLCEGKQGGADQRLLFQLVTSRIQPAAGKASVRDFVVHLREVLGDPRICAIIDADFPRRPQEWRPQEVPEWIWFDRRESRQHRLGFTWPRKEIENYWVDPEVLARVFRWSDAARGNYEQRLSAVFDDLGPATAARIALTTCAPRRDRLSTHVSLVSDVAQLEEELRRLAARHNEDGTIEADKLVEEFQRTLPLCSPGGLLRTHALAIFAGKDILARIQNTAGFPSELKDREKLVEAILDSIRLEAEPHRWLPEWTSLREAVDAWEP